MVTLFAEVGRGPATIVKLPRASRGHLERLRNITAPLPEGFAETFLDDGYMNMYHVMRALHESGFTGAVISDHVPGTVGSRMVAEAFSIGYMKALVQAASS